MPITTDGFAYTEQADRVAAIRSRLSPLGIQFSPGSRDAILTQAIAETADDVTLELRDATTVLDPSQALGTFLDSLMAIRGLTRATGSASSVVLSLTGTPGTTALAGEIYVVNADGIRFVSTDDVTLAGVGVGTVTAICEIDGEVAALAGTLIATDGLPDDFDTVTNDNDATLGTTAQSDASLWLDGRVRLAIAGASAWDSLYSGLFGPSSRAQCSDVAIFWNDTEEDDSDGRPAGAVEVVVIGGSSADVGAVVFANTFGLLRVANGAQVTVDVPNIAGGTNSVIFSRASEVSFTVAVTVLVTTPITQDQATKAAVKAAVVAFGLALHIGESVLDLVVRCRIADVSGVIGIPVLTYAIPPESPSSGDQAVSGWQIARFATGRITVTVTR